MFGIKGLERSGSLIIVTGLPASGKSSILRTVSSNLEIDSIRVNDYCSMLYREYKYSNLYEKGILKTNAINNCMLDLMNIMRTGKSVLIEYEFTDKYNKKFDDMCRNYGYTKVVINCKYDKFNIWWKRYLEVENVKDVSLRCTQFKDKIIEVDTYRTCDRRRQEYMTMYDIDYYHQIRSKYSYTGFYVWSMITGRDASALHLA